MADKHANMPGMSESQKKSTQGGASEKPAQAGKAAQSDKSAQPDKAKNEQHKHGKS